MSYANKCLKCGYTWDSPTEDLKPEACPNCRTNTPQMIRSAYASDPKADQFTKSNFIPTDKAVVEKVPDPNLNVTAPKE